MFKNILFAAFSFFSIYVKGCNVLSLSGGGSFGINEVAILKNMYDTKKITHEFDIITGISAGGLNSGVLNFYKDTNEGLDELKNIYFNLTNNDIYKKDDFHILNNWSFYNTEPLRNTITNLIYKFNKDEKITIIGATDVYKGKLKRFNFHTLNKDDKINVLMATSAIPLVFPPIHINNTLYADGGVLSNEIIPSTQCDVLVVSAHPKLTEDRDIKNVFKYTERIVKILFNEFNDETSKSSNIQYCYPTSTELEKYSILDFDNAEELYSITYDNYNCEKLSTNRHTKSNDMVS
jgi:NTE family protein